jgi:NTE family protein
MANTLSPQLDMQPRPNVAVVLSGGGARGIAHIGVLKALEEAGIPIDLIVGTSIGAVIGGLYAAGYTADELAALNQTINWNELFNDAPPRQSLFVSQSKDNADHVMLVRFDGLKPLIPAGYRVGQKVTSTLSDLFLRARYHPQTGFDDLKIPFRAVTTDLVTGRRVVWSRGNLSEIIRASFAVPIFFTPVAIDSYLLMDGGLVDCVPADVARELGARVVVAVNLSGVLRPREQLTEPLAIADQVLAIMMRTPNERILREATVVVTPPVVHLPADFSNSAALVDIGAAAMREQLPALRTLLRGLSADPTAPDSTVIADTSGRTGRPLLRRVVLTGVSLFPVPYLAGRCSTLVGRPFDAQIRDQALALVQEYYWGRGYAYMRCRYAAFDTVSGTLTLVVREGVITDIRLQGNQQTADFVVARELPFNRGEVFNVNRMHRGIANIYGTGLFEYVNVEVLDAGPDLVVLIKLVEHRPVIAKLGLRYDRTAAAQSFVELGHENVLGTATKVNARYLYGQDRQQARSRFRMDRILRSYFSTEMSLGYQQHRFAYRDAGAWPRLTVRTWGGQLLIGSQIRRFGHTSLGLKVSQWRTRADTGVVRDETRGIVLRSLVDTIDKTSFPTSGKYNQVMLEAAQAQSTGQAMYVKAFASFEAYYRLNPWLVFHPRVGLGAGDQAVPFLEKFFAGGPSTRGGTTFPFIGYREYELWGRNLIKCDLETRATLWPNLYGLCRYQAGYMSDNVNFISRSVVFDWELFQQTFRENFYYGLGGGLGVATPLGPVELTYGYGDGARDRRGRWDLTAGYDF